MGSVQGESATAEPAPPLIVTPDAVKAAEQAALNIHKKLNIQAAPIRHYLEGTVVPVLMQGLQAVCKERPENPVEYLAYYLLSHNPQNAKASTEAS
ncbi:protein dpy-30 [Haematococcus lacustris]